MLVRIKYGKMAEGRYLSHLDLMRTWERSIRRAKVPLAFSQGFNPHPKMSFGSALAVGTTSSGEYMDIELTETVELESLQQSLMQAIPPALEIYAVHPLQKSKSLMSLINRAKYVLQLELLEEASEQQLKEAFAQFLASDEVLVMRFKKNSREKRAVNIRSGVYHMEGQAQGKEITLWLTVQTGSEGNVRPEEVVYGLMEVGLPVVVAVRKIHREGLYVVDEAGQLISPLTIIQ